MLLRGTPRGSRKRVDRPHAVSERPMLIHASHAMPMPRPCAAVRGGLEKSLSEQHGCGMARAWHGRGMVFMNQIQPYCVNQMGKTLPKLLAARHGNGSGEAWHV
jgi:hypothetical protein